MWCIYVHVFVLNIRVPIRQGLNLDECWSTYDQIERPQTHGQYQDVGNLKGEEEEEEIQLEKPWRKLER